MALSAVPQPTFGDTGFIPQQESAILSGVQSDLNNAFGGGLNQSLNTPQGQIAQSETAILGDVQDQFCALANGVDPAFASGRMQDAIGRIYFLSRIAAQPTVVQCTCSGAPGTVIPIGATAADSAGNLYLALESGTISLGGTVSLSFANSITGPLPCPPGTLTTIYQALSGWTGISNAAAGVLGQNVETRAEFEQRRQATVAANSSGSLAAVRGAVFGAPGVVDVYTTENSTSSQIGSSLTGYITVSGGVATLNVSSTVSGTPLIGDVVVCGAAFVGAISGTTLSVSSVTSGALAIGMALSGVGVASGTTISSGSGSTWGVSVSQTTPASGTIAMIASALPQGTTIASGTGPYVLSSPVSVSTAVASSGTNVAITTAAQGQILAKNSLYVAAAGGQSSAIASAIWSKKAPGCDYSGSTTVSVSDNSSSSFIGNIQSVPFTAATFIGFTTSSSLEVMSVTSGLLVPSQIIQGPGLSGVFTLGAQNLSGSHSGDAPGGAGLYALSPAPGGTTVGAMVAISYTSTLTVTGVISGAIEIGQIITGDAVSGGTAVLGFGTGTGGIGTYIVSGSQSVNSEPMVGSNYSSPFPTYPVSFQVPSSQPIYFNVAMQTNGLVPANATALIQAAIINAFNGADGGARARIGSELFASRYYAGVASLGNWSMIKSITIGIIPGSVTQSYMIMQINQVPVIDPSYINVVFS